jgi:Uma2 family endonuclease
MSAVLETPSRPKTVRRPAGRRIDPERLPKGFELVDDKLVEKEGMGFHSGFMTVRLIVELGLYLKQTRRGVLVGSDATFACVPGNPRQVRKPDAAVIFVDPATFVAPIGNYTTAPDIVIEVVSPNDSFGNLFSRLEEFLAAGSKEAWLVNPQHRYLEIHTPDGTVAHHKAPAIVTSRLLPEFELPLAVLFG